MIIPFVKRAPTFESVRDQATDGISTWLLALVDRMPGLVPERTSTPGTGRAVPAGLRRFVHEMTTRNPVTRTPLSGVQVRLIELALDCVDWPGLAGHPRLRDLDWSRARPFRTAIRGPGRGGE